jgi:glycosyltransferase involved in cell wall biosynthesis
MHAWIVANYEPIPTIDPGAGALRCGMLAEALRARGSRVTWWTSTFHHVERRNRFANDHTATLPDGTQVEFVYGPGYQRTISWQRVRHNAVVATRFSELAARHPSTPDVILACMPTPELSAAALDYGNRRSIPVVVDTRDLWPDVYLTALPAWLRPLGRLALFREYRRATALFSGARAITAVSDSYLDWSLHRAGRTRSEADRVFPIGFPDVRPTDESRTQAQESVRRAYGLDAGNVVVCFVGMFGASYDLACVIDAARRLQSSHPRIRFILAGGGDRERELRARAEDVDSVLFPGWLSRDQTSELLAGSDIGLAAYTRHALQSLPNKPFQYLAFGLPIANSLRGELDEMIRTHDIGASYVAGDDRECAAAIAALVADPGALEAMRQRSRALFERDYSADRIYDRFSRYLADIAARDP